MSALQRQTVLPKSSDSQPICQFVFFRAGSRDLNIYVGNLSYQASEDEIRQAFEAHGQVSAVNIIKDRETGRSRGFAFVEMPDQSEGEAAINAINQQEIAGRAVTVNEARPRQEHGGGRRGGQKRW